MTRQFLPSDSPNHLQCLEEANIQQANPSSTALQAKLITPLKAVPRSPKHSLLYLAKLNPHCRSPRDIPLQLVSLMWLTYPERSTMMRSKLNNSNMILLEDKKSNMSRKRLIESKTNPEWSREKAIQQLLLHLPLLITSVYLLILISAKDEDTKFV